MILKYVNSGNLDKKYTPCPNVAFPLGISPYHSDTEYFGNLTWAWVQIALGPALQAAKECGMDFRVAELSISQALLCDGQGVYRGHSMKLTLI